LRYRAKFHLAASSDISIRKSLQRFAMRFIDLFSKYIRTISQLPVAYPSVMSSR
jgi:hypothetical protein